MNTYPMFENYNAIEVPRYDAIPKEWKDGEPKEPTDIRYIQRYSPIIFALQLTEEITKSGADILFDCMF